MLDEDAPWDARLDEFNLLNEAIAQGQPAEKIAEIGATVTRNKQQLQAFKAELKKTTRATFRTPDDLKGALIHALAELRQKPAGEPAQGFRRQTYLEWLKGDCESVELLGLELKEAHNVRLRQVYVPAVIRAEAVGKQPDGERPEHELLLHRLGRESLYVPGAPGAGKSMFCRWAAWLTAAGAVPAHEIPVPDDLLERLPDGLQGRLPVLCRLRDLAAAGGCTGGNGHWTAKQFEDALTCWLDATAPGGLDGATFLDHLHRGGCLLILDGLDELPVSETRDGATRYPRANLVSGLADALPGWRKAGNRLLLTSRPYGLGAADRQRLGLPEAELAGLPEKLQQLFIRRWYAAADYANRESKAAGLIAHLAARRDLRELQANPMLLTALCVKYDEGRRLPEDVYKLYHSVIDQVLYNRFSDQARGRDPARRRLGAVALGMHTGEAMGVERESPAAEVAYGEIEEILARYAETQRATEGGAGLAGERRERLLTGSGLLMPSGEGRAGFYHLSFQEFLAAERLELLRSDVKELLDRRAATAEWRRTLVFFFCAVAERDPQAALNGYASLTGRLTPQALEENPNPALLLADCLEIAHARGWGLEGFAAPYRAACDHALELVEPLARARLWDVLGQIGLDDRFGVGVNRDGVPEIDWVEIPAGEFVFQEGEKRRLPAFHIARYPVTNTQFRAFLEAQDGHGNLAWWGGFESKYREPVEPGWSEGNHPREQVDWYQALAFCRWLSARLGYGIRLPTEEEWERAARFMDGREYPWGDGYRSGFANVWESGTDAHPLWRTSPVGIYPRDRSEEGVEDLSGNVWEWCSSKYDKPEVVEPDTSDDSRVVRGGSWFFNPGLARAAVRVNYHPDLRYYDLGFRVWCAAPIRSEH